MNEEWWYKGKNVYSHNFDLPQLVERVPVWGLFNTWSWVQKTGREQGVVQQRNVFIDFPYLSWEWFIRLFSNLPTSNNKSETSGRDHDSCPETPKGTVLKKGKTCL